MLPEISRRCLSCGAAVRAGARFCPQCGQKMTEAGPGAGAESGPAEAGAAQADEAQPGGGAGAAFAEWGGAVRPESAGRVSDTADVPAVLDSESAREWTPPTKEFSAFIGSSGDGAARTGGEAAAGGIQPEARGASADLRGARETSAAVEVPPVRTRDVEVPAVELKTEVPAVELPTDEVSSAGVSAVETPDAAVGEGLAAGASADEARGRVARVREGARERVGRMREEALVVLEEAPDDSGLRFVLTAAALFVVFLVILFLSTTVLR